MAIRVPLAGRVAVGVAVAVEAAQELTLVIGAGGLDGDPAAGPFNALVVDALHRPRTVRVVHDEHFSGTDLDEAHCREERVATQAAVRFVVVRARVVCGIAKPDAEPGTHGDGSRLRFETLACKPRWEGMTCVGAR